MSTFCGLQRFLLHGAIMTICVNVLWFTMFYVACRYTDDMTILCQRFVVYNVFVAYRYTDDMCQRFVVYCCMSLY